MSNKSWLLKIAAEVEADPSRWTQGAFARTQNGNVVNIQNISSAACWCARGFAYRDKHRFPEELWATAGWGRVISVHNDSLADAAEFVAWFRAAAEMCE